MHCGKALHGVHQRLPLLGARPPGGNAGVGAALQHEHSRLPRRREGRRARAQLGEGALDAGHRPLSGHAGTQARRHRRILRAAPDAQGDEGAVREALPGLRQGVRGPAQVLVAERLRPRRHTVGVQAAAAEGNWSHTAFLRELLELEVERRIENRKNQRVKRAGFPQLKYLQELQRDELPEEACTLLPELETLDFIREGRNAVLYGNPGTGKTHLATALGIKACMDGYSVMFTSVPHLLTQIRECRSQMTLRQLELRFERFDLVVCDEFGYVSFDKEGGELLFNHLSLRAGKRSTIITTNLAFSRWNEVIKDKVLCAALVDRLTHKAFLVNMTGESYRVKETLNFSTKKIMLK